MVDWIFQGKFGNAIQSNVVPQAALRAIQSITYQFIWRNQKEVSWKNMDKLKRQGGIGVRDYKATQQAAIVDRACRMWEKKGIWSDWMCRRDPSTKSCRGKEIYVTGKLHCGKVSTL